MPPDGIPSVIPQRYEAAVPLSRLTPHPANPNAGDTGLIGALISSNGYATPVLAQQSTGLIIDGEHRVAAAGQHGMATVPVVWLDVDDDQRDRLLASLNESTRRGLNDEAKLVALLQGLAVTPRGLDGTAFDGDDLDALIASLAYNGNGQDDEGGAGPGERPSLADRFLIPPFDVLDARQGWWQDRKRRWIALGIRSELGRGVRETMSRPYLHGPRYKGPAAIDSQDKLNAIMGQKKARGLLYRSPQSADPDGYRRQNGTRDPEPPDAGYVTGTSVFDPVLCELAYRWFSPPGGTVVDPFAGGSVRGLVAAVLGRTYRGCDLSAAQVAANVEQRESLTARGLLSGPQAAPADTAPGTLTPVEEHGGYLVKRDDLFTVGGSAGGKARTCLALAGHATGGLVTAGSRHSPQVNIVATVARLKGLPCRVHVPASKDGLTPELAAAQATGAEIVQHRPGHNSVIVARARDDAAALGWTLIPFGMECAEAVEQTAGQAASIARLAEEGHAPRRIVVPVGSGMSLAGVLAGLARHGLDIPVLGVAVGADPSKRLDEYAPGWRSRVTLVTPDLPYDAEAPEQMLGGLRLDPVYEAKCLPYLSDGDLLWVVGCRETARPPAAVPPRWDVADAAEWVQGLEPASADLLFTCPPYLWLERYSDDPADLSTMTEAGFAKAFTAILAGAAAALKDDRFAVIVTGDARDPKAGVLADLRGLTIRCAAEAGLGFHCGAVLVTAVGSLPVRAARQFEASRILGRTHQDCLVFCKGDRKKAAMACGPVDVSLPEDLEELAEEEEPEA